MIANSAEVTRPPVITAIAVTIDNRLVVNEIGDRKPDDGRCNELIVTAPAGSAGPRPPSQRLRPAAG